MLRDCALQARLKQRNRFAVAAEYRLSTPLNAVSERGRVERLRSKYRKGARFEFGVAYGARKDHWSGGLVKDAGMGQANCCGGGKTQFGLIRVVGIEVKD